MAAIRLPLVVRYGLVSGTCLTLNNLILILADFLHQPLLVGVAAAFLLVGAIGFRLHCRFTFPTTPSWPRFARYLCAMAANTPFSIVLLWIASVLLAWPMVVAAPVASCGMILVNFLMSRRAILGRGRVRKRVDAEGRWAC